MWRVQRHTVKISDQQQHKMHSSPPTCLSFKGVKVLILTLKISNFRRMYFKVSCNNQIVVAVYPTSNCQRCQWSSYFCRIL